MFFKKRKEKKAQELNTRRLRTEELFSLQLKKAERIEDPTEKILALQKLSDDINAKIVGQTKEIDKKADSSRKKTLLGGVGGVCATGVTAATIFTTPVGGAIVLGVTGAAYLGAAAISKVRGAAVHDKLMLEATGHAMNLGSILMAANDLRDVTIANNPQSIANSPLRDKVLAFPDLSAKFLAASAKHAIENKQASQPKKRPSGPKN